MREEISFLLSLPPLPPACVQRVWGWGDILSPAEFNTDSHDMLPLVWAAAVVQLVSVRAGQLATTLPIPRLPPAPSSSFFLSRSSSALACPSFGAIACHLGQAGTTQSGLRAKRSQLVWVPVWSQSCAHNCFALPAAASRDSKVSADLSRSFPPRPLLLFLIVCRFYSWPGASPMQAAGQHCSGG